ncbi:hypothetical protein RhiirC2_856270 [Rhizophagus irregularis]|uniref:Uncharacterized protein n=1 Tax=Rhizophagus irregularis TaxID=588596 RepID=A0A2N1MIF3_9GLOM|nr:hypothetical protein RhiirC2_856270 [Rhizophagus irregularis]
MTTDRCTRNTSTTFYNFLQGAFDMTTDRYLTFDINIIGGNTPICDYVADLSSLENAGSSAEMTSVSRSKEEISINVKDILYHENSYIKGNWLKAINRLVVSTDEAVNKINIKSLWNVENYKWDPVINDATNYIDELINNRVVAKEKRFDISNKDKKMKSNSKKHDDTNVNVLGFSDETKWNKWNDLAFHRGGTGQIFR